MTAKMEIALIIIGAILLLLVGGKKLPELARGIGEAGRELRKGFNDDDKKDDKDNTKKS